MKSPSSMTIIDSSAELKMTTTFAAVASEKENDVVSAAISLVTPPRPYSSASGDLQDEGTAKVDFERQAHHFPAANVSQKRAVIDIADEGHQIKKRLAASKKNAPPKKLAAKKRAAKAAAKAKPKAGKNTQAEPSVASPPLVDLLNIDHFSIIRLPLFNKMIPGELQKFCLKTVGLCDTYTKSDGKLDRRHSPARGPLYCKRHSDPSTRCANCKTRGLPDGSETKLCSTCLKARKCRVEGCKDQRNCGEHGHLHKYCKKHRNRNTRCARCNVKALEGGAKTFCLDCKKKFRKEMEEALSLSLS